MKIRDLVNDGANLWFGSTFGVETPCASCGHRRVAQGGGT